ncbi:MAG: extracellular solute-binding protein [Pseudomonadota bacterium]
MTRVFSGSASFALWLILGVGMGVAQPQHAISMYGDPALPPDFVSLPQANPNAPEGGTLVLGERGGFDSMNPYILKGRAPWAVRAHTIETLLGRNYDEPFALYGLLAESVEVPEDRSWVEFVIREQARFSSGDLVTVDDVIWSFETLGTLGHPRYAAAWLNIADITQTGPRAVKITFKETDLEAPLLMGLRPILRKADWDGRAFDVSSLDVPTGSGPYIVEDFEPGRFITLKRDPDYWGNDIAFNQGMHNFDEIRYEYFTDGTALFEAFKRGDLSFYREFNAVKWAEAYDVPAVNDGRIVRAEIPHQRPTGLRGFVMNTRNPLFADHNARDAMITLFNYEFIAKTITGGNDPRITSYFSNSVLAASSEPASGKVADLLEPFAESLPSEVMDGYSLPKGNPDGRDRRAVRKALQLLGEEWSVQNGVLTHVNGQVFQFDVLLKSDQTEEQAIWNLYADALKQAGIRSNIVLVDDSQYTERLRTYDFDVTFNFRPASLSPGNEQKLYWGSEGRDVPGTRNYPGVALDAVDEMISKMVNATRKDDFRAAAKALDRLLSAGRFVIPIWHTPYSRVAHSSEITYPEYIPMYGDWSGFMPNTWHVKN